MSGQRLAGRVCQPRGWRHGRRGGDDRGVWGGRGGWEAEAAAAADARLVAPGEATGHAGAAAGERGGAGGGAGNAAAAAAARFKRDSTGAAAGGGRGAATRRGGRAAPHPATATVGPGPRAAAPGAAAAATAAAAAAAAGAAAAVGQWHCARRDAASRRNGARDGHASRVCEHAYLRMRSALLSMAWVALIPADVKDQSTVAKGPGLPGHWYPAHKCFGS